MKSRAQLHELSAKTLTSVKLEFYHFVNMVWSNMCVVFARATAHTPQSERQLILLIKKTHWQNQQHSFYYLFTVFLEKKVNFSKMVKLQAGHKN